MDSRMQAALLIALAAISLRLGLTDAALAYIKPSLQPALVAAGVALGVLGVHSLIRTLRAEAGDDHGHDDPEHASGESHAPAVAWLLVVPLLALLLIAPPALGSFAAAKQGPAPPAGGAFDFGELPEPTAGAVDLAMSEYILRALYDPGQSLDGLPVRLLGFATPTDDGRYLLTRFTMNCCAADATVLSVEVLGDADRAADTWLEIEGRWQPRPGHEPGTLSLDPPLIVAERVTAVPAPPEPYEY